MCQLVNISLISALTFSLLHIFFLLQEIEAKIKLVTVYNRKKRLMKNEYIFNKMELQFKNRSSGGRIFFKNDTYSLKFYVPILYLNPLNSNYTLLQFTKHKIIYKITCRIDIDHLITYLNLESNVVLFCK